ncbi:MAG: leucine-rich repeat domain-containing protein [Bacteroidaceae bacterium]|nr:leucine-rich repeat domain-containing protein [Bacteroidaceae bacterium]
MRKTYLLLISFVLSICTKAANGETFTAKTIEGIDMTFKVLSEDKKTIKVEGADACNGDDWSTYWGAAISEATTGNLTIPQIVTKNGTNYTVTELGMAAFSGCWDLTSVVIPASVTSIGNGAFSNCHNLTSVDIPNSVTYIGRGAFMLCI